MVLLVLLLHIPSLLGQGGGVSPTITFSQTKTVTKTPVGHSGNTYTNQKTTSTSTITTGLSYTISGTAQNSSGATINTSTGQVSRSTLGSTLKTSEWIIMKVTFSNIKANGVTIENKTIDVKMQSNKLTTTWGDLKITTSAYPTSGIAHKGGGCGFYFVTQQEKTEKYEAQTTGTTTTVTSSSVSDHTFSNVSVTSGSSYATVNSSTIAITFGRNYSGADRSATVSGTATKNGKSATFTASVKQFGVAYIRYYGTFTFRNNNTIHSSNDINIGWTSARSGHPSQTTEPYVITANSGGSQTITINEYVPADEEGTTWSGQIIFTKPWFVGQTQGGSNLYLGTSTTDKQNTLSLTLSKTGMSRTLYINS